MQILIADKHALVRSALRTLVEEHGHRVVAEVASGPEAVEMTRRSEPDVALLDLEGSPFEMMAAGKRISSAFPHTAVVVLAGPGEHDLFLEAVSSGARGFVTRDMDERVFCTLLERAAAGEIVVAPELATKLLEVYTHASTDGQHVRRAMTLTPREHEVLSHMTRGQTSNRELAAALDLSENTVRFHVRNILEKFHVHSRAAVVAYACSHDAVALEGAE